MRDDVLKNVSSLYDKIRNPFRYMTGILLNYPVKDKVTTTDIHSSIVEEFNELTNQFNSSMNNKPNLEWCVMFLEDRETRDGNGQSHKLNKNINKSIKSAIRKVKESTNEFSHLKEEDIVKYPFISNSFLLFEILTWLPEFAETHYKNYI